MNVIKFAASLFSLVLAATNGVHADTRLQERVASGLAENDGWELINAELIAERLELSFALHDATGTLDNRIRTLRSLSGNTEAQDLAVAHPGYLDAILIAPDTYPTAIRRLGLDNYDEAALLAAILRRPTAEGLRDSANLIDHFGEDLTKFAPDPAFPDLFEVLSWIADDAPPGLLGWLDKCLHEASPDDIVMLTEVFFTHRVPLRDPENAMQLEEAWRVLKNVRRTDPALFKFLLSHRGIWQAVATPDFRRSIEQQMHRGQAHALRVLVHLLGKNGALYEMSESLNWPDPLPHNQLETALRILQDDDDRMMAAMFHYREDPTFWNFAGDGSKRALLPCLIEKAKDDLDQLETRFSMRQSALEYICKSEVSGLVKAIPFYSIFDISQKMIAGVPVGWGDAADLGLDVGTTMVPIGKLGIAGRLVPGLRLGGAAAKTVGQTSARIGIAENGVIVKQGFDATVANTIRMEAARVAKLGARTGLGRAFGVGHQAVSKAMAANPRLSEAAKKLGNDYSENVIGDFAMDALSTEFLRCASQPPSPTQPDMICQDVERAVVAAHDMEATP
jgi:hypothetical protein